MKKFKFNVELSLTRKEWSLLCFLLDSYISMVDSFSIFVEFEKGLVSDLKSLREKISII